MAFYPGKCIHAVIACTEDLAKHITLSESFFKIKLNVFFGYFDHVSIYAYLFMKRNIYRGDLTESFANYNSLLGLEQLFAASEWSTW